MSDTAELDLVDVVALRRFLAEAGVALDDRGPAGTVLDVSVLSGGLSNLTYLVRSGRHEHVVRRRPLGHVAPGAHDMRREFTVLSALQSSGLPIPVVYGFCDDETIVGAPFYAMSCVHGSVFHRRADVATLQAHEARAVSEAVVEVLDRLHRIDPAEVGLGALGRPDGFVARRIGRWMAQWEQAEHRDHPAVDRLGRRLLELVPLHADATLVHGDYRLGNMLIDLEADPEPGVAAVLDWEMSTLGDPLTDLAHLIVYWDRTRGRLTHESQLIAEHPGFASSSELAEGYARATGRDVSALDFYLAFEHWRAAIIKEAIFTRQRFLGRAADRPGSDAGHGDDAGARESVDLGESVGRHLEEAADLLHV